MEDQDWSKGAFLPENYTSLLDLKARWMKKQQEEKDRIEKERQQQQQEKEYLKQLQPHQQNQRPFHLHSSYEEEEGRQRRTPYNRSKEVDSRPKAYNNHSNSRDDRNAWGRSIPQVVGGMYRNYGVDRRPKLEVLAYENVAMEERESDESELINEEKKDYESRRERDEGEVKEPEEVEGESLPVVVSSTAMTDGEMKLRADIEGTGVVRNPRAEGKGTVSGRREENAGEMEVPVDEKKDVVEDGVEAVRNPEKKRKGKKKAREEERVGQKHMPAEKRDAVDGEVESNKVQVVRNNRNKKKGKLKAGGDESVSQISLSIEEDAKKDDLVNRRSGIQLKGKSGKEEKKENERSIVVEVEVKKKKKKKDASVARNSRTERNGVKRENRIKSGEVMVESKEMEMKVSLWKDKGSKIRAESESMKEEVGDEKEQVRNLSMQYTNNLRGSNGMESKPAKDNENNIRAESKSLKDENEVVEDNMRNEKKTDPGKENESEIEAESEVWKNAAGEKLRNILKIEQGKGNENKIRAEIEVLKDEVGLEEKLRHSAMPYGNGPRGSNGMKTELGKVGESFKTGAGEVGGKSGGFALKLSGYRGGNRLICSNGVHRDYKKNNRCLDVMRREKNNSGREMVWVKKEESGDGKAGGTGTSSLD